MDGTQLGEKGIQETQRYVKLTRALILKKILRDSEELSEDHRQSMEQKLVNLMHQLEMNEEDFDRALEELQKKGNLNRESEAVTEREGLAYCLSRSCRHQFKVNLALSSGNRCLLCGGPTLLSI